MKNPYKTNKVESLKKTMLELKKEIYQLKNEKKDVLDVLNSTLHEVRRFSAQLSKFSERLCRETEGLPINQTATSIYFTAGMISSRLAYTDIELNPRAIENQTTIRSGIFKKFDKARRILAEEARNNDVTITLDGECFVEIEALPIFELLPFVLIENAIKYPPKNQNISVKFDHTKIGKVIVTISSIGPYISKGEILNVFDKGFRGKSVENMPGQGLGLFLAKQVCDFHDFRIKAESDQRTICKINNIDYSNFKISLEYG
ncbi:sensor histidine kinase [Komagataeibacter europaeus]|uniref:sensor histidine kinase n=1 Tax=Komagataeibacter europaeus TaxID=33995 RepID=UPI000474B23F|nr:ATP-binding protein [Komagataeibacter europaeus]